MDNTNDIYIFSYVNKGFHDNGWHSLHVSLVPSNGQLQVSVDDQVTILKQVQAFTWNNAADNLPWDTLHSTMLYGGLS